MMIVLLIYSLTIGARIIVRRAWVVAGRVSGRFEEEQ
jgi:hypothetical protein